MTRRALASWAGAIVCIAWAVLTAWAFVHAATRRDDVQPYDPETIRRMTFGGGSATIVVGDNLTMTDTYASPTDAGLRRASDAIGEALG